MCSIVTTSSKRLLIEVSMNFTVSLFSAVRKTDSKSELSNSQLPTLTIRGSNDENLHPSRARYLKENISRARLDWLKVLSPKPQNPKLR
jgi:hypothetical protein